MLKSARRFTRTGEGAPCARNAAAAAAATSAGARTASANGSPGDHETGSTANSFDLANAFEYGTSGNAVGAGGPASASDASGVSPLGFGGGSASGSGLTPEMMASWGAMAGMSPASFDSALSAAIGVSANHGGAASAGYAASVGSASNGITRGMGAGIQLTPPTMAGFAALPVGVGVGIGPGFSMTMPSEGHGDKGNSADQADGDFAFQGW